MAIGGDDDEASGNITIHNVNIRATGGHHGAGIGGGEGGGVRNLDLTTITIYNGDTTATGGTDGAGIGGGDCQPGARTYIYGGKVTATGGRHGAGIGGGDEEGTFGVFIYGGEVTAQGGNLGAGIGAGEEGGNLRKKDNGGGINIHGGKVTATGGDRGAGIGSGNDEKVSGTIYIDGDTTQLTVQGGEYGAGIGGGGFGDVGATITIATRANSTVNITGGWGGAGIGGGYGGNMDSKAYIQSENTVNVTGGLDAAGIGGGCEGSAAVGGEGGTVYVGGNLHVTLEKSSNDMDAIGRGYHDWCHGTVYIAAGNNKTGKYLKVVYGKDEKKIADAGKRTSKCHSKTELLISECDHKKLDGSSALKYTVLDDTIQHRVYCPYCGWETTEDHTGAMCPCGISGPLHTVTLLENNSSVETTYEVADGAEFILPEGNDYDNYSFVNRFSEWRCNGMSYGAGDSITVNGDIMIGALYERAYAVDIDTLDMTNGSVSTDKDLAQAGETVYVFPRPDDGYQVDLVMISGVIDEHYYEEELVPGEDGKCSFVMPAGEITVSVEFTKAPGQVIISDTIENGTVTPDMEIANEGETVTLTVAPDNRYHLEKIRCRTESGADVEVTKSDDSHYTFVMPAMSVIVSAEFDPAVYTVTFDKGNTMASGQMAPVQVPYGTEYTLPECEFTAPESMHFTRWIIGVGDEMMSEGDKITITEDVTISAHYDCFAELKGYTLSLDGDIGINFYMKMDDFLLKDEYAYMRFTVQGSSDEYRTQKVSLADTNRAVIGGQAYYVFKCRVAAKEMTSAISAQMFSGENPISDEYTYSVREYAEYILANSDSNVEYQKAVPLVKAMLNYGTAAQAYFGTDGEAANATPYMTDEDRIVPAVNPRYIHAVEPIMPMLPEGLEFDGYTLSLRSETTLSLYFICSDELSFSCSDGYDVVTTGSTSTYQVARIRGIKASDLDKPITLTVTCGDNTYVFTYSVLSYCKAALSGNHPELEAVITALYRYYEAAENYVTGN